MNFKRLKKISRAEALKIHPGFHFAFEDKRVVVYLGYTVSVDSFYNIHIHKIYIADNKERNFCFDKYTDWKGILSRPLLYNISESGYLSVESSEEESLKYALEYRKKELLYKLNHPQIQID